MKKRFVYDRIDTELGSQKTLVPGGESQWIICRNDPVNYFDPDGNLEVFVWNPNPAEGSHGHASMVLDDGEYISWWPGENAEGKLSSKGVISADPIAEREYNHDVEFYDREPDNRVVVSGLNEQAILAWWNTFSREKKWKSLTQNCSTICAKALDTGGADVAFMDQLYSSQIIWTPLAVVRYAYAINRHEQNSDSNQETIQRPWFGGMFSEGFRGGMWTGMVTMWDRPPTRRQMNSGQ